MRPRELARRIVLAAHGRYAQARSVMVRMTDPCLWTADYPNLNAEGREKLGELCKTLLHRTDYTVFAGPFAGMRLVPDSYLANMPMMIVGCYEQELHAVVNEVIARGPKALIDIGSAHGFYTVGFARHLPEARVVGFEAVVEEHWGQARLLAEANGVQNQVQQCGRCTVETLCSVCPPEALILCDCEGGEAELLDPAVVPVDELGEGVPQLAISAERA